MDLLSFEKLQLFLVIVLPGFVAIKVFDLISPQEKRDLGWSLIEAAVYGLFNFALWSWYLVGATLDEAKLRPVLYSIMFFIICVASPTAMALVATKVRKAKWFSRLLGRVDPRLIETSKSAWDDFFNTKQECWVICHMKSGRYVGGLFSEKSYATLFPKRPELYIERAFLSGTRDG